MHDTLGDLAGDPMREALDRHCSVSDLYVSLKPQNPSLTAAAERFGTQQGSHSQNLNPIRQSGSDSEPNETFSWPEAEPNMAVTARFWP